MTASELVTNAEQKAESAESLRAFSGIKLLHVKRELASALELIGRDGIFDQYTKHDISHINYLLGSLEWLLPEDTKEKLTPAEWMMLTLSIYFHDFGMLVTKDEYKNRDRSLFPSFKAEILSGSFGADFQNKIANMVDDNERDRFIYQELVRKHHAERVRSWILGESMTSFPNSIPVAVQLRELIGKCEKSFLRDLAEVCASHQIGDLGDHRKFPFDQQYGPSSAEVANVHFCAIVLRTCDLLHVTSDRTPNIQYTLINPTDPQSQEEWAKQKSVRAVRPQRKLDKDGAVDAGQQSDTVEVLAQFHDDRGYFSLINYINFANQELRANYQMVVEAKKKYSYPYSFPWRMIDDSKVEAEGFEKQQFEFRLDQRRILDLLVGHTLYNDATVVMRELIQNGIDATKLMALELSRASAVVDYQAQIDVFWDPKTRELEFRDNGTGMTVEVIENHLLRVGSSRYQDSEFRKEFPEFSPISRFGIGLLTCFLVADDVDIYTKPKDAPKTNLLKIRKVHGKYLLKYVDEHLGGFGTDDHGTRVVLQVRRDVDLRSLEEILRRWIVLPACGVTLHLGEHVHKIGHSRPEELLRAYLANEGYSVDGQKFRVETITDEGVEMAYAQQYDEYLKEWTLLNFVRRQRSLEYPVGICVEGIRVDFNSPGFSGRGLLALVNSTGINSPRTNVARSNLEATIERDNLIRKIYVLYLRVLTQEVESLVDRGFSITWAGTEFGWLLEQLCSERNVAIDSESRILDSDLFDDAVCEAKGLLIERGAKRELLSLREVESIGYFWTVDSAAFTSANSLIKEARRSNPSALGVIAALLPEGDTSTRDLDILNCSPQSSTLDRIISKRFQVDRIRAFADQRRLDLHWTKTSKKIWEEVPYSPDQNSGSTTHTCYIQKEDIVIEGLSDQSAISSGRAIYILKSSELNSFILDMITRFDMDSGEDRAVFGVIVGIIIGFFSYKNLDTDSIEELIEYRMERRNLRSLAQTIWSRVKKEELIEVALRTNFTKFDTSRWYRRIGAS